MLLSNFKRIAYLSDKLFIMKILPVGEPNFAQIIKNNWLYVDKTEHLFNLLKGKLYFLSRPRRFGKSLTIYTLQEILLGNKELFKGLWIYDKYDFPKHPVIRISFSSLDYKELPLEEAISIELHSIAKEKGIELTSKTYSLQFKELIIKLGKEKQVAILIDEYDKPIVDYIDNQKQAIDNKDVLKNFYSSLKDLTSHIKLFFVTGVSKFSGVSIFSDLNNLHDLTLDKNYSSMLGYTKDELETNFAEHIQVLSQEYEMNSKELLKRIQEWYNGYSWDGKNFVYNPFSILELFTYNEFGDYWFRTGTPTFLMKLINKNNYTTYDIENRSVDRSIFEKHDIENIEINSLLFQTGYLTIKEKAVFGGMVKLNYPNKEVEKAFSLHLLSEFTHRQAEKNSANMFDMIDALHDGDVEEFMSYLKDVFSNLTYHDIDKKEKYFHSIFYVIIKLIGYQIESEILTNKGRIDCVLHTKDRIYIIEFKVGTAEKALKQIKDKGYAEKYLKSGREITLLGIGFDKEEKNISDWKIIVNYEL